MDLVLTGANVLTMDRGGRRAEALAVRDGKIAAVGKAAEVARLVERSTRVVDLAGRTLMPGFIDPHNHFGMNALEPVSVDCSVPPLRTADGVLEALRAATTALPPGRWLRGWGYSARNIKGSRRLTHKELDEAAPDNPVAVMDHSYHAVYANSLALTLAGLDRASENPRGGWLLRDDDGELNGTLWERAMDPVHSLCLRGYLDFLGDEGIADLVYHNCKRHLALGITSVGDALVMPESARMYRLADARGKLPLMVRQMLGGDQFFAAPHRVASGGEGRGDVSDRLRGGTMKLFMDPVFPSSALIQHHAHREPEHVGERFYTQPEADELITAAHRNGLQVMVHCLGTGAIEQALTSFERAQRGHDVADARFRIEHFGLPTPAQIRRARDLGVVACVQPGFMHYTMDTMGVRAREMGGGVTSFPFRSMLDAGMHVAGSSDYPCAMLNPLSGIYSAVTRRTWSEPAVVTPPEEGVSAEDALRMYTINAAHALFRDGEVGSLEVGKRADMVVLSHDPTAVDPLALRDLEVLQTYVDGKLMYERWG